MHTYHEETEATTMLSEREARIRSEARAVIEKHIKPNAAKLDREGIYPWDNLKELAKHGYCGIIIPKEYGGLGLGLRDLCIVEEEIGRGCGTTSQVLIGHYLCMVSILWHGNEEQKHRYLPPLARGEKLGTFAITEPASGSNVAEMTTTAAEGANGFVLNGRKHFIGNAGTATVFITFAATDPEKGARGISSFIVEKGSPGFSNDRKEDMMGLRGADVGDVVFNDCLLPVAQLLGARNRGFHQAMQTLDVTRPMVGAQAIGVAQAAFEESMAFSKKRVTFGKPIFDHQSIKFSLADMFVNILAGRLLILNAASIHDSQGKGRFSKEASAAKLFSTEAATRVVGQAVQIHGGYGYTKDCPVERMYRDVRVFELYEGTSEIQRLVIARRLEEEMA